MAYNQLCVVAMDNDITDIIVIRMTNIKLSLQ
jgi:hypothetical protein